MQNRKIVPHQYHWFRIAYRSFSMWLIEMQPSLGKSIMCHRYWKKFLQETILRVTISIHKKDTGCSWFLYLSSIDLLTLSFHYTLKSAQDLGMMIWNGHSKKRSHSRHLICQAHEDWMTFVYRYCLERKCGKLDEAKWRTTKRIGKALQRECNVTLLQCLGYRWQVISFYVHHNDI